MRSKAIAFLCLLALVMMIASEVTARELAETKEAERTRLEESKYDGYGRRRCEYRNRCGRTPPCHKCCHYGKYGKCHCCKPGEKPVESVPGSKN